MEPGSSCVEKSHKCAKKKKSKSRKKSKKARKHYSSTSSDSSTSDSSSSHKKRKNKLKKQKKEKSKKKLNKKEDNNAISNEEMIGPAIPNNLVDLSKKMKPETKEEWEKRQNVIRKVYDEQTGRYRIIKGDGEILEEIVSKERHQEINKQATIGDGEYYQAILSKTKMN